MKRWTSDHWLGLGVLLAFSAFVGYTGYQQRKDAEMDRQLENLGRTRTRVTEEYFDKFCGDRNLLRVMRQRGDITVVELYTDDWLHCIQNKEDEDHD